MSWWRSTIQETCQGRIPPPALSVVPQVSLCRAVSQLVIPSLSCALGCSSLGSGLWHLPLLSFVRVLSAHFSSLSSSLWMVDLPCINCSSTSGKPCICAHSQKNSQSETRPWEKYWTQKQTKPTNKPTNQPINQLTKLTTHLPVLCYYWQTHFWKECLWRKWLTSKNYPRWMIFQIWHFHLKISEDLPWLTLVMSGNMCWNSTKVLSFGFACVISCSPENHFSWDREQPAPLCGPCVPTLLPRGGS